MTQITSAVLILALICDKVGVLRDFVRNKTKTRQIRTQTHEILKSNKMRMSTNHQNGKVFLNSHKV